MAETVRRIEKAELHLHLEGSVEPATLVEIDGSLEREEVEERYRFGEFRDFIASYIWVTSFLRGPDEYALACRRLLERLAAENVRYAEINLSAGMMLWRGIGFAPVYDALVREAARSPVEVFWVLDAVRHFGPEEGMRVARLAADRAGDRVAAVGIGGDEARGPAGWFTGVFRFAREHGLGVVPHAGETGGPESVRDALAAGADRIGHGIRAVEDPVLLRELRERDVPLEVCISSNVATGAVPALRRHPVRRLWEAGVPLTLNTDDPAMFRTTLSREYEIAAREFGFRPEELGEIARNGFRYAFRAGRDTRSAGPAILP